MEREKVDLVINMGPQHPSTHGVLRLILELKGEKIVGADTVIGYVHRGVEKLAESRRYMQVLPVFDRVDYVSATSNELGFVLAVEKLLGISERVPERAQYLRVIMAELTRISSHLLWLGTHALELGAMSVFLYAFREREKILDLFEEIAGGRLHTGYMRIGGVANDATPKFLEELEEFLEFFPEKIDEYETLLTKNRIWLSRTKGVGVIDKETAINWGITGPTLRAAGCDYDVRKYYPYCVYDRLEFDVPVFHNGDVYDRYRVRMEEMRQSVRIIKQCLEKMPEGPVQIDDPHVFLPPKEEVYNTMVGLLQHFELVIHGIKPPPGEVYAAVEGPRGELGYYIVSDGSDKPYRLRIRPPSLINIAIMPELLKGHYVADVISIIGSLDPLMGEVDR
ncbi:NADH dehydrogenase (quinone) subunit D [Phorcysia thermohydrogeniphila]|uniref:NADH-quinone oxidoreductase subunit D n=1 Tax=Phorcysia thermohydrogeniphila TaxID=936138 RepID=A0A4R1GFC2_9BACT|nr:NADH dehydrogenase (quinone) subunit D [Phorcysia thermohydrogeniphila]TCK05405.1 NADH-quinone oxidoreductase subunit D [Phorcysia thermohydrogeniphila]